MRTIADKYMDEGFEKGVLFGITKGLEEGLNKGLEEGVRKTAINMIRQKLDLNLIATVTGLSIDELTKLKAQA